MVDYSAYFMGCQSVLKLDLLDKLSFLGVFDFREVLGVAGWIVPSSSSFLIALAAARILRKLQSMALPVVP
jgi:hypothetical protein